MQDENEENEMKISKARKAKMRGALRMALSPVLKKRNERKATTGVAIAIPSSTCIPFVFPADFEL